MYNVVLSPIDTETLINRIANKTAELIAERQAPKTNTPPQPHEPDLITRREALKLLSTTPATLWRWENQGKVQAYGIGGKRYYKRTELLEAITLLKK